MRDGLIDKLKIIPFEDSETLQARRPSGPPFIAQFNPESFSVSTEFEIGPDAPAQGDDGEEAKFKSIKPRTFGFDFLLDGTGATGEKRDVIKEIKLFEGTVGFSGQIHRPRFLELAWGTFAATCALETYSVNYKLFTPNGAPLRAVISATFKEHKPIELRERKKNKSSPDIAHLHSVKDKEHLTLITWQIYKNPKYYYHVAEANNLNNLRKVEKGTALLLPPQV